MVPCRPPDLRGAGGDLSLGRLFVIFNPASGRGRGRELVDRYLGLLRRQVGAVDHGVTTRAGEEWELADRAVADGYDTVVAVGGDGTWSHVADRLLRAEREVRLGILPAGTGNDFGRNLGIDHADPEAAVAALASGRTRRVDVGRIVTPSRPDAHPHRDPGPRHFLNVLGFGFDVAVIDAAAGARFLRGELLYKVTALQQLFRFRGFDASLQAEGEGERAGGTLMLTISNGRFFGGGFPIAPDADIEDGTLHACRIADARPVRRALLFNRAERGRHVGAREVELIDARRFTVTLDAPPRFEADGDVHVASERTVAVEVLPGRLPVVAG